MKKHFGFTLIEMTVSLIILGILAAMSINAYFGLAEKGRWAEAREVLLKAYAGYQRSVDDRQPVNGTHIADGSFWTKLGMSDPNSMPNQKFVYTPIDSDPLELAAERCTGACPALSGLAWTIDLDSGRVSSTGDAPLF